MQIVFALKQLDSGVAVDEVCRKMGSAMRRFITGKSEATYNNIRPHGGCDNLTPCEAHKKEGELTKKRKNYSKYWLHKKTKTEWKRPGNSAYIARPASSVHPKNKELPLIIDFV